MKTLIGQGIVFRGELKFAIKTGSEGISRVVIAVCGIGYYQQVKLNTNQLQIPAVYPRQI